MSVLVAPDDPTEYMQALGPIMIAGTAVGAGSWFVEEGVDTLTAQWPALILTCPDTEHALIGIQGQYLPTFQIVGTYLDRWESSGRTLEQIMADAKAALYRMARNVRATPDLGLTLSNGQAFVVRANELIRVRVRQPVSDPGLGFTLATGRIDIRVIGPYFLG